MKIKKAKSTLIIFLFLIEILFLSLFFVLILHQSSIQENIIGIIFLGLAIILLPIVFISFGSYEFKDSEIEFKCPLYRKQYRWSDFKYIGRYKIKSRSWYIDGFVFSLTDKKLNRLNYENPLSLKRFTIDDSNGKFDKDNLLRLIKNNAPKNIYVGYLFNDEKDI